MGGVCRMMLCQYIVSVRSNERQTAYERTFFSAIHKQNAL